MRLADHTFVISRKRDEDRRYSFTLKAHAVPIEGWRFFDAIDGESGGLATMSASAHGRQGRTAPNPLCAGEIGCLLSHLAIWRTVSALGRSIGSLCILEDDVEFLDWLHLPERWERFMFALPRDAVMVHLAGESVSPETEPVPVNDEVSRVVHTYGTSAMILFPEAISMLSNHPNADTMREPADWLLLRLFETGRVYCPREPLMRHTKAPGITP